MDISFLTSHSITTRSIHNTQLTLINPWHSVVCRCCVHDQFIIYSKTIKNTRYNSLHYPNMMSINLWYFIFPMNPWYMISTWRPFNQLHQADFYPSMIAQGLYKCKCMTHDSCLCMTTLSNNSLVIHQPITPTWFLSQSTALCRVMITSSNVCAWNQGIIQGIRINFEIGE